MKHCIIIIYLLSTTAIHAQFSKDSTNYWSISGNIGYNQLKDKNIHSKSHNGLISGLVYTKCIQKNNLSKIGIGLHYSRPKTAFESLNASVNAQISINYQYLWQVDLLENFAIKVGPRTGLCYNIAYYPNWDDSHLYWGNHLDLGIQNLIEYRVSESNYISLDIGVSIISFFSRPNLDRQYKIDELSAEGIGKSLHSNMEFGTINKAFDWSLILAYSPGLTSKHRQSIFYQHNYSIINSSNAKLFQNNIHSFGLKYYFL